MMELAPRGAGSGDGGFGARYSAKTMRGSALVSLLVVCGGCSYPVAEFEVATEVDAT